MLSKIFVGGFLAIMALVVLFVFSLRSCLSKYDERSVKSKPLVFSQNEKTMIFTIVQHDKTTSYRQRGNMVSKSISSTYFLQTNDGVNGNKIAELKIKKHSEMKSYWVEVLGACHNTAWLYIDELLAYNPFSLEKIADQKSIEEKNPFLKDKLPKERRYYKLVDNTILITALDGITYELSPITLQASVVSSNESAIEKQKKAMHKELTIVRQQNNAAYSRFRENNRQYALGKLALQVYKDSSNVFDNQKKYLASKEDSINTALKNLNNAIAKEDVFVKSRKESINNHPFFNSIKINSDTINGKWFGLFNEVDIEKQTGTFYYNTATTETSQNKFYTSKLIASSNNNWLVGEDKELYNTHSYLQGGFLLNTEDGMPIHLSQPDGYLIASKNQIGSDGVILLSRIDHNGKQHWQINTGLKEFLAWTKVKNLFYVFGADNKELTGAQINVLHIIDLSSGSSITHDYFVDSNRAK
jgi:hypothetical protein